MTKILFIKKRLKFLVFGLVVNKWRHPFLSNHFKVFLASALPGSSVDFSNTQV